MTKHLVTRYAPYKFNSHRGVVRAYLKNDGPMGKSGDVERTADLIENLVKRFPTLILKLAH